MLIVAWRAWFGLAGGTGGKYSGITHNNFGGQRREGGEVQSRGIRLFGEFGAFGGSRGIRFLQGRLQGLFERLLVVEVLGVVAVENGRAGLGEVALVGEIPVGSHSGKNSNRAREGS